MTSRHHLTLKEKIQLITDSNDQCCHLMKSEKQEIEERKIAKDKSKLLLILSISRNFKHFFISMALFFILIAFQIKT